MKLIKTLFLLVLLALCKPDIIVAQQGPQPGGKQPDTKTDCPPPQHKKGQTSAGKRRNQEVHRMC